MSLDKVLQLAGAVPALADPDADLLLAAQLAAGELAVLLAADDDDSGGDDKDGDEAGGSGGHADHPAYKALVKRDVPPKRAAAMCAKSDKKVKASQLAGSLAVILAGHPGQEIGLVTLSGAAAGPRHLHSAAVLAALGRGDLAQVRRRAGELGVDVSTLPGFGLSEADGEKAADTLIALAAKSIGDGGVAMNHGPFTGTHTHGHFASAAHDHPHQHVNDNTHDGGPLHRPGSSPKRGW
jgi:hypothetical protein